MDNHDIGSDNKPSRAKRWASSFAESASQAVKELTARKYALPDKHVASQLLMYRQLLHTKCRPGLRLSRPYDGTPAQKAVKHMPWWCQGCEETGKMVISYENLIRRLWLHGAMEPYNDVDYLLDEDDKPPIPHEYWVRRLGFQQADPVTDFRSGGVLSLAMMVHVAESCPDLLARFCGDGDASVLPFGITSINITDMLAKFLMLTKTVDRMDALLSEKPFWRMFEDPNALTACQELCCDLLADVVVEMSTERRHFDEPAVTVFDFSKILEVSERRVQYDLLGAGPKTVAELYAVHKKIKAKYKKQLQHKLHQHQQHPSQNVVSKSGVEVVQEATNNLAEGASNLAGTVLQKIKVGGGSGVGGFNPLARMSMTSTNGGDSPTQDATEDADEHDQEGEWTGAAQSSEAAESDAGPDRTAASNGVSNKAASAPNSDAITSNGVEAQNGDAKVDAAAGKIGQFSISGDSSDDFL